MTDMTTENTGQDIYKLKKKMGNVTTLVFDGVVVALPTSSKLDNTTKKDFENTSRQHVAKIKTAQGMLERLAKRKALKN